MQKTSIYIIVILLLIICVAIVAGQNIHETVEPDAQTRELCRQWAQADHSGGVPPVRLQWLKESGIWNDFDWYGSCLLNNGRKVAE